ncbi:MerR family transcriptional regulator [Methyloligella sp. 2.7D]|uniref:MerR family transcriptional regulator n=1 Tax=unclassified Methyloligella TaxID=2625955 RepID=UPI001ABADE29|nr:MerR family transcriptional regulator [Methyloligella sp. GL2]
MLKERDLVAKVPKLTVSRLRVWVNEGWIRPTAQDDDGFSEADLARAALIRDLLDDLGFGEEEVPVVLNLIDQIHGLRGELRCFVETIDSLSDDTRTEVKQKLTVRRAKLYRTEP